MRYVLDTNVVSALRLPHRNPEVATWARGVLHEDQFVTAFTIAEIERGVCRKEAVDPAQGEVLRRWFAAQVLPAFEGRVLPFDLAAARIFAKYPIPGRVPIDDAQIAAVAMANSMVLATRNIKHFAVTGVAVFNPWLDGGRA